MIDRPAGRWAAVAAWLAVIYFMSSRPSFPLPGIDWMDELIRIAAHFGEYAVLGFLLSRAIAPNGERSMRQTLLVVALGALYALGDEWHQSFVPNRDASWLDLAVDTLGALAGCVLRAKRPAGFLKPGRSDLQLPPGV